MKSLAVLLAIVSVAISTPLALGDSSQVHLDIDNLPLSYPGFDLDLNAERWVQVDGAAPVLMTELEKIKLKAAGIKFFDVTDTPNLGATASLRTSQAVAYGPPSEGHLIEPILETLSVDNLKSTLIEFTSFRTRYYRSDTGKKSQEWLVSKINEITAAYAPQSLQSKITVQTFAHAWAQSSVIVRIDGADPCDDGVVIIGAHQDSTNSWPFLAAPGADDDASGSMTILESYRSLIAANYTPSRAVEIHFYSAEEGGLLGSQAIVQDYEQRGVNVVGMSHFDMSAWVKRGTREEIGIIVDFVDNDLSEFNRQLVDAYLDIPHVDTKCGYACSDHASWTKAGYPAVFTIEGAFENSGPYLHSANDRWDVSPEFSFTHMRELAKLAVAFVVELSA